MFAKKGLWPFGELDSILDVACGLALKSKYIPAKCRVGVDIYDKYFAHIEAHVPYVTIRYDVRHLLDIFQPKSFDVIIATDIVEHLEKEEALDMISQCEIIAKKAVILETPSGFVPQNIDILGYGGHEFQTHRSGWNQKELEKLGYSVFTRPYEMSEAKRHTELDVERQIELLDAIKML